MTELSSVMWPVDRLGQAIEAVARRSGLLREPMVAPSAPPNVPWDNHHAVGRCIDSIAHTLGLEAEPALASYAELDQVVHLAGPAIVYVPGIDGPRLLALLGPHRKKAVVIGPDHRLHKVDPAAVRGAICQRLESSLVQRLDHVLSTTGIADSSRLAARSSLLRAQLGSLPVRACWMLRLPPGSSFRRQLLDARLHRRALAFAAAQILQLALFVLSWWIIGRAVLRGELQHAWLIAWALLLLSIVPVRSLGTWVQGVLAIRTGALLKQRLMAGALRTDSDDVRGQGTGKLLSRVVESEAVESLALSGGFLAVVALVEIAMAAVILRAGAGGALHLSAFAAWLVLTCLACWLVFQRLRAWTRQRLTLTHDLTERMTGHRTRQIQERPERWHDDEDQMLEGYIEGSAALDRVTARASVILPRGWIVLGLGALAPAYIAGEAGIASTAVALGGMMLAGQGMRKLMASLASFSSAAIAWSQVRPLFQAAATGPTNPRAAATLPIERSVPDQKHPMLCALGLVYRHRGRAAPVLGGCDLNIYPSDRLLLEGPSGCGKSTFASVLAGLRQSESGLLLLNGLDPHTIGLEDWRRRIVAAPQFHENHIVTGSLAFNLLMGCRWPAEPDDLQRAEQVCRELQLGDLLDRMPAGLQQTVGETGWQLSHGEKSRVFIARAILQDADLLVLDESFAALDPSTLRACLECVLSRARTVLVIAHP
ncbi:MAG: ABC transporter ATP-binding protein/permease [Phycisphaerales bacterium]|nr:ABC transporter ATP-binding protein/permease [Phycisphaerales bacterium]